MLSIRSVLVLLQGLWPSMVMVINPTIQYIVYESLVARALAFRNSSRRYKLHGHKETLGALDIFALSAMAKIIATLITYPMLVIKNRLQVGAGCTWGLVSVVYGGSPVLGDGQDLPGWSKGSNVSSRRGCSELQLEWRFFISIFNCKSCKALFLL